MIMIGNNNDDIDCNKAIVIVVVRINKLQQNELGDNSDTNNDDACCLLAS